ncbi:hypothetical protein HZA97_08800 [Candidatus Woesearchaeota archaeon]|nr:hypothetical protein [Candidatus Woesearchaeota archaeon]
MSLEELFNQSIEEWVVHCKSPEVQFSSFLKPVFDCDVYRKIVSMGRDALPFIRQFYDKDSYGNLALEIVQGHGLPRAVREIVGEEFEIPEELSGRIILIEEYTKNWLDKNMK